MFGRFKPLSSAALVRRASRSQSASRAGHAASTYTANDVKKLVEQVGRLVSEDRLIKAKGILIDAVNQDPNNPALLKELASVENKRGDHGAAVKHLAAAWKRNRSDVDIASEYARSLYMSERAGEALSFIHDLPIELQRQPPIRTVHGDIYYGVGWPAHALIAYGNLRGVNWRSRRRCVASWLRCGGPFGIRSLRSSPTWALESKANDFWKAKSADRHAVFETINLAHEPSRAEIKAHLETSLLWLSTAQFLLEAQEQKKLGVRGRLMHLGLAWLVAVLIIYTFESPHSLTLFVVISGFVAAEIAWVVMVYSINIVKYVIDRGMRFQFGFGTWFLLTYAGLALTLIFGIATPAGITGILIAIIGVTSALWLNPLYRCLRTITTRRQTYLREFILGNLLDVLLDVSNPGKVNDLKERSNWIEALQDSAFAIDHFLVRYIDGGDTTVREWISTRACEAASIIRQMACNIAVPSQSSWEELASDLRQSVTAIASGDFGALPKSNSAFSGQRFSRRRLVTMTFVRIAVVFTILIALIGTLVAFKSKNTIQLAGAAVITALVPVLIGILLGILKGGTGGGDIPLDSE